MMSVLTSHSLLLDVIPAPKPRKLKCVSTTLISSLTHSVSLISPNEGLISISDCICPGQSTCSTPSPNPLFSPGVHNLSKWQHPGQAKNTRTCLSIFLSFYPPDPIQEQIMRTPGSGNLSTSPQLHSNSSSSCISHWGTSNSLRAGLPASILPGLLHSAQQLKSSF